MGQVGLPADAVFNEHAFNELFGPTRDGERQPQDAVVVPHAKTGERVLLHGLTRADLNGRYAVVLDPTPREGRYHLRLEDTKADVRARSQNFTSIVSVPTEVVEVDRAEDDAVDTATLLHGDCCICLMAKATQAVVPCGHLALCDDCAPEVRTTRGTCPICRRRIYNLLRVFVPGGNREEELEKAIGRCREAEKRVSDLEAQAQKSPKRPRTTAQAPKQECAKRKKPEEGKDTNPPEVGSWVKMPTLSARNVATLLSPEDTQHSQSYGKVVSVEATTLVVRFHGVEREAFVEHGKKESGDNYQDVHLPSEFLFQAVYTPQEAAWRISEQDKYSVFALMKDARKKKLQGERRAERKQSKAADTHIVA